MNAQKVRYHAVLSVVLAGGLAGAASAQNALGDGRGLETRLQTRTPQVLSPVRSFTSELAFREAIMSGTAPSGLSYRGTRLPSRFEFRGELGEDALFAYRRDSLYSGLAGQGIRGTDALQYQSALTVGAQVPASLAGQLSYARAGTAERGSDPSRPFVRDVTAQGGGLRQVSPDEDLMVSAVEVGSPMLHPVRSLSSYAADYGLQPTLVGLMQNRVTHQTSGQTASPLLGVQVVPVEALRDPSRGLVPVPRANAQKAVEAPLADPTKPATEQPDIGMLPAYEQMIERYKGSYGPEGLERGEDGVPLWAKDLVSIQRTLRGLPAPVVQPRSVTAEGAETPDAPLAGEAPPLAVPEFQPFAPEVLRRVREAGGLTESFVATDLPQIDRYAAYMRSGEDMLAAERYFDAEEVFISALTARPRDVNASLGRAHAQIGAGLYMSAGLNVRQLLVRHPEVSAMRYGVSLLPSPERMRQVAANLRESLGSATSGADAGLLLAYLGYQRSIEADMRDGLAALETHGDEADQRLVEMLRAVWLGEGEAGAVESPSDDG